LQPSEPKQGQPAGQEKKLSQAELDQIVAPIALYPDPLLSNVMMAATYSDEVVEAKRWLDQNKSLKGRALKAAADKQDWDNSVKELTATPPVLAMMSDKRDWMEKLGDAVFAQQQDVMDAVQRLRARAQAEDKLKTTKQQKVTHRRQDNRDIIAIEPVSRTMAYVPYYDPGVVYGVWPYPAYPPYFWPGYYYGADPRVAGLTFAAFAVGAWAIADNWWGGDSTGGIATSFVVATCTAGTGIATALRIMATAGAAIRLPATATIGMRRSTTATTGGTGRPTSITAARQTRTSRRTGHRTSR
jgi:hypothetical protein